MPILDLSTSDSVYKYVQRLADTITVCGGTRRNCSQRLEHMPFSAAIRPWVCLVVLSVGGESRFCTAFELLKVTDA